METVTKFRDPDVKLKGFSHPNGEAKKPHRTTSPLPPQQPVLEADEVIYRECLKNHAASLGGHALDGCGEFMPSQTANPADPTSLKCAPADATETFTAGSPSATARLAPQRPVTIALRERASVTDGMMMARTLMWTFSPKEP
ncbi:hypothetical protein KFK09_024789 [Dendrobium nobile]|uniref:ZF-HD dimerization-type domain-containing protein n=1 Tax=Dendrobium nobile TaxID=94219 RepID=A0A8T3AER8_DENNO|nr:hypothetical protein KFK09_024789 [Dendrobium nobile]